MTVTAKPPVSGPFFADGVNREWDFHFKTIDAKHLRIIIQNPDGSDQQVISSGITVPITDLNQDNGGKATYPHSSMPAIPVGKVVFTARIVPYEQPNRIGNQGRFDPQTHEKTFDLLEMQIQQLAADYMRAWKAPVGQEAGLMHRIPSGHMWISDENGNAVDGGFPNGGGGGGGSGLMSFDVNANLASYNNTDVPAGTVVAVRRSRTNAYSGGGLWRLTVNSALPSNGVTVIRALDGRYWEKISGQIDFPKNAAQVSHPQSTASFEIRVPSQIPTITAALDYLSRYTTSNGGMVDIFLEAGFVMQEQVWINAQNFGWVTIFSADAEVRIDTSYCTVNRTQDIYGMISRAAFTAVQGAVGPRIGCTFDMGSPSGEATQRRYGLLAAGTGTVWHIMNFRGFKNSGSMGIYANRGAYINAYGCDVSGAKTIGVYANRAQINCHNVDARNCGLYGIAAIYGSRISAYGSKADNCGSYGFYANFNSKINVNSTLFEDDPDPETPKVASATGCPYGIRASGLSEIHAQGIILDNCTIRGLWAEGASKVTIREGSAKNCGEYGAFIDRSSTLDAYKADFDGAGTKSVVVSQGSNANLQEAKCSAGIQALLGSTINANGSTGALNVTANTVGPAGVIYKFI